MCDNFETTFCECLHFRHRDFEKLHDIPKLELEFYVRYKVNAANDERNLHIKMHKYEFGSVELLHVCIFDSSSFFLTTVLLQRHSQSIRAVNRRP